ncbi:MAG: alkaline phosphatase D family protein [Myxococcales bacterium]|nr:alkaline phosphatase D family protein [Myxococcales bacterium]MCB9539303.1 alkaline phosphatase D family protein [Myxococcales bacterium]
MRRVRPGLDRRTFLKLTMTTVAAGSLASLTACDDGGDDDTPMGDAGVEPGFGMQGAPEDIARVFPQAFASGDPSPSSVILWTRVAAESATMVAWQVARDAAFTDLVTQGEVEATADSDHTVRLKVTDLEPGTTYHYRFRAEGVVSDAGRTRTAPAADAEAAPRFAFASCQDYNGRYYHAWRVLADQADDLDFVLFLGDYIYETADDPRFQEADGRRVTLPDGLDLDDEGMAKAALTLADYRALYKQYRGDPQLQRAHKRLPFVAIWDDHEFADDSWQDHSTHFNGAQGDEQDTARRTAASRAWFEFQPVDLDRMAGAQFPDDLQIYRTMRWGKHLEVFLTDQRSYRDDHLIPEGPTNDAVGKTSMNSALGSRQFLFKNGFDPLEAAAMPTMLGAEQKAWLLGAIQGSDATWKVWGNEVMQAQFAVDLSGYETVPESFRDLFYFTVDQWDGYRSERAEILEALRDVDDLVVLTGDLHAWQAAHLRPDFDTEGDPTAVEFVCAGISSRSFQEITKSVVDADPLLSALGLSELVDMMDALVLETNPHFAYTQNTGYGFATVAVSADAMDVTFHDIASDAIRDPDYTGGASTIAFRVAKGSRAIERV